jgi:hypothetical protein
MTTTETDERRLPSVTRILRGTGFVDDPRSLPGGEGSGARARGLERGRAVHLACQLDDEGTLDEETVVSEVKPFLAAFRKFKRDTGSTKVIWWERPLTHHAYGFMGRPDTKRWLRGHRTLIDVKTGETYDPASELQLALYAELDEQQAGERPATDFALLLLKPDGEPSLRYVEAPEMVRNRMDALAAVRVYQRLEKMGRIDRPASQ